MKAKTQTFRGKVKVNIHRVLMEDYCEEDGAGKRCLSIPLIEKLAKDTKLEPFQQAAAHEMLILINKGKDTIEKHKAECEGKKLQSVPRMLGNEKHEWHHLCLSGLDGSDTIGTNVIPLLALDHVLIHVLLMFLFKEWQIATSAVMMLNMKHLYLEDVLNSLDSQILHVNKKIFNLLVTFDRQSRSEAYRARKNQTEQQEPKMEGCIQFHYTDEATEEYFREKKLADKSATWKRYCSLEEGEVFKLKNRPFTKGPKEEDLRLKHHINSIKRAEDNRIRMAHVDLGDLTEDKLKRLVYEDSDGVYAIRSKLGHKLGKIKALTKVQLRKLCGALRRKQGTKKQQMVDEVIDFLETENLENKLSQMNI